MLFVVALHIAILKLIHASLFPGKKEHISQIKTKQAKQTLLEYTRF